MTARPSRPVLVAVGSAVGVAILGGTLTKIGPWYEGLAKPSWNPPNWVFGPVWTLIYALAVVAAVRGWRSAHSAKERASLLALFFLNGLFNVVWSCFFFTLQRPDWAL